MSHVLGRTFKCVLNHSLPLVHVTEAGHQDTQHSKMSRAEVVSPPIMAAEVGVTLKSLRNGCASGICSITVEQLKHGGKIVVSWLTCIMNYALSQKFVPDEWHKV